MDRQRQITGMGLLRAYYRVPARRGMRVEYLGGKKPVGGVITGERDAQYLLIRLDGETKPRPFVPDWMIKYLPEGDRP